MKTNIGLWIDHRKAVIVLPSDTGEEIWEVPSHSDKQPGRIDGERSTESYDPMLVPADDILQRKFTQQLNTYYDEVIACVHEAQSLLIFGPGEAKGELRKRLEKWKPNGRVVNVEAADKMTDRQIAAKVRDFFEAERPIIELR